METKESRLEKVEKIDIKKSINGFKPHSDYDSYESQGGYCPKHVPTGTEKHHVSHVLTFFSFMAYNVTRGRGVKEHLLDRAVHHLRALREFVEDQAVIELVNSLFESARIEHEKFPRDGEQPAELICPWLGRNQKEILRLAECYQKKSVFDGLLPIPVSVGIKNNAGTAIQGLRDRHPVTDERLLGQLFRGYFNNKMSVLVFLIQAKQHKPDARLVSSMCCFLDDLYHHMLEARLQHRYRRIFSWLKRFLQKLPKVRVSQRSRAISFIRSLYATFGIDLHLEINFQGEKT